MRVQQRKIKPKQRQAQFAPPPPPKGANRALQARTPEGYSPSREIRLTLYLAVFQVVLLIVGVILFLLFNDLPLRLAAALALLEAIVAAGHRAWPAPGPAARPGRHLRGGLRAGPTHARAAPLRLGSLAAPAPGSGGDGGRRGRRAFHPAVPAEATGGSATAGDLGPTWRRCAPAHPATA